ncbi:DUF411 domain-containing protein [Pseudomonadota bacterium]
MLIHKIIRNLRYTRQLTAFFVFVISIAFTSLSAQVYAADFTVYKSPQCGCCANWVDHLKANGHHVTTKNTQDLTRIKQMAEVPEHLRSCHTAMVDGYVIEGHVPAKDISRLLAERPKAKGLAVPGMPMGSPGMEGAVKDNYNVMLFQSDGSASVYANH